VNLDLLRQTWEAAARHGDAFFANFYGRLFLAHPELRPLFGTSMEGQREKIAAMLDLVVRGADNIEAVVPEVRALGERHRRYGVTVEMFAPVGEALLETFGRYLGDDWTDEAAQTWGDAFALVSGVMADVIGKATEPATWDVMVLEVFRLGDVVHIVIDVDHEFPWHVGGFMPVRLANRPGSWRDLQMMHARELLVPIGDRPDSVTLDLLTLQPGDHLLLALPLDVIDQEVTP
jgi:hemoglobin-like flavoprotein